MTQQSVFSETLHEGIVIRRQPHFLMFGVAEDGRVLGARGFWLKPLKKNKYGHAEVKYRKDGKLCRVKVHRLIAEAWVANPEGLPYVDHLDANPANNAASNLRWCSHRSNHHNRRCRQEGSTSSKYIGVTRHGKGWAVRILIDGTRKYLGSFAREEAAAAAYNAALESLGLPAVNAVADNLAC